jgi:type I restriction enzyme S subunit
VSQYKPYPKYKPSGVEWIGEIPEGWDVTKVEIMKIREQCF